MKLSPLSTVYSSLYPSLSTMVTVYCFSFVTVQWAYSVRSLLIVVLKLNSLPPVFFVNHPSNLYPYLDGSEGSETFEPDSTVSVWLGYPPLASKVTV